jgi:hypothetical protein
MICRTSASVNPAANASLDRGRQAAGHPKKPDGAGQKNQRRRVPFNLFSLFSFSGLFLAFSGF